MLRAMIASTRRVGSSPARLRMETPTRTGTSAQSHSHSGSSNENGRLTASIVMDG